MFSIGEGVKPALVFGAAQIHGAWRVGIRGLISGFWRCEETSIDTRELHVLQVFLGSRLLRRLVLLKDAHYWRLLARFLSICLPFVGDARVDGLEDGVAHAEIYTFDHQGIGWSAWLFSREAVIDASENVLQVLCLAKSCCMVTDALRGSWYLCLHPSLGIELLTALHFELLNLIFKSLPLTLGGWSISPNPAL